METTTPRPPEGMVEDTHAKDESDTKLLITDETVEFVEEDIQIDLITATRNRSSGRYFIYLEGDRDGNDAVINPVGRKIPFDAELMQCVKVNYKELSRGFIQYDTRFEGGEYPLPKTDLIILIFETRDYTGRKCLFTTIRRYTPQKWKWLNWDTGHI